VIIHEGRKNKTLESLKVAQSSRYAGGSMELPKDETRSWVISCEKVNNNGKEENHS